VRQCKGHLVKGVPSLRGERKLQRALDPPARPGARGLARMVGGSMALGMTSRRGPSPSLTKHRELPQGMTSAKGRVMSSATMAGMHPSTTDSTRRGDQGPHPRGQRQNTARCHVPRSAPAVAWRTGPARACPTGSPKWTPCAPLHPHAERKRKKETLAAARQCVLEDHRPVTTALQGS